ncbi:MULTISPECIES: response regulator [Caproicibacterium]|jgi:two-component system response regulator YesN|uniref:Stage 0 sporulation protein A homolog n=2 Tax=Caproicibacterium lactatifermentans TaxID=2666138 RepID=A0A859DS50_9FIRM|nr:response regulator [Caproicibacterium lactatifermentans]QKN23622.1 response regulator [Caproicibacterium lactatifermentans]QKO29705.1 response regulator [Caproicibacterium lactatifermentans]
MYRILIADDEKDEREAVKFLLKKYKFELDIVESENGHDALQKAKKQGTDILLTDVRMPFLLGTELASQTRELYPNVQIIFFSGYNDFPYVKKALTLGAVDYILKPINPEELRKVLEKAIQKLNARKQIIMQKQFAAAYLQNHVLSRLLYGAKAEMLCSEYRDIDLAFLEKFKQLLLLQFDNPIFGSIPQDHFEKSIAGVLRGWPHHFLNLNTYQSVLFLQDTETDSSVAAMAQILQKQISADAGEPCYISISSPLTGADSIAAAYAQAEKALDDRFFFRNCYVYPIPDKISTSLESYEDDDALLRSAADAIRFKDSYSLQKSVNMLLTKYQHKRNQSHINVSYILSQLATILYSALPADKEDLQVVIERLYFCQYFEESKALILDVTKRVVATLAADTESTGHTIRMLKQFIQNHYGEELSLSRLAKQFYLSPHYLSDLFISETGCGINKYIKTMRMEKAKEQLLNTNEKIQDICKSVGYTNFSYFCRSFRETFGQTPESYRQSAH